MVLRPRGRVPTALGLFAIITHAYLGQKCALLLRRPAMRGRSGALSALILAAALAAAGCGSAVLSAQRTPGSAVTPGTSAPPSPSVSAAPSSPAATSPSAAVSPSAPASPS